MCHCWCEYLAHAACSGLSQITVCTLFMEENFLIDELYVQKSLKDPSTAVVILRLDEAGNVWHVEFSSNSSVCPPHSYQDFVFANSDLQSTAPKATILKPTPGPQPHLNKPIVLTAEGKIPVKEIEKTFLQKYWWVLLGGVLLMMSSGSGGE